MLEPFATVDDVEALWRPLTASEEIRAGKLLQVVSNLLRQAARDAGQDLDEMIAQNDTMTDTAMVVTVDVVSRVMRQATDGEPMSQETQTALGYTFQGTYAIPGGGIANAIMRNDLKRLGIYKARIGVTDPYGCKTPWNLDHACR